MHQLPVKYLIMIEAGGAMVARLFNAQRGHVADIDAATEDVVATINGLDPTRTATDPQWDDALAGHNATERAQALVYTLKT